MKPRRFAPRRGRWPDGRWRCHRHAPRFSQSGHLRSCLTPSIRTVRPAHETDSPALHPLHSSRSSPAFRRNSIGSMPGLCSFVPTAANRRDSQKSSCAPGKARHRWSRGFARPGPAITRDASHGQDTAIGREAPPGQDIGNNREHGHFPDATLRWRSFSPPGRMSDLTDKTKLV